MAEPLQTGALSLYVLTFNCARALIDIESVASQLFSPLENSSLPDLVVLSLQELAPLSRSFIGGSFLVPYFDRFIQAVQLAARKLSASNNGYVPVAIRNTGMTGLMVFARDVSAIKDLETAGVGYGVWDMGNKAAVGVRFKYSVEGSSTELTFVAAHLEAMEDAVKQRNDNWRTIARGLVFSSSADEKSTTSISSEERPLLSISSHDATVYKSTSHLFVAGDLNYRTSTLRPSSEDVNDVFPQPTYESSSPNHYSKLFESDQLNQERLAGRTLHGLTEAPVTFPPTYKYEAVEPFLTPDDQLTTWHWATHRWPSWTDRILYLEFPTWINKSFSNAKVTAKSYTALPLFSTSDHRAVGIEFTIPIIPIPVPEDEEGNDPRINPPFEIDVDWKSKRERARLLEIVVGFASYFTTTWEGGAIALALAVGTAGAVLAIQAMIES